MLVNCTLIADEVEQKLANPSSSYNHDGILENLANLEVFGESQEVAREGRQFQDDAFAAPNAFPVQQPQSPQPTFRDISGGGGGGFGGSGFGGFGNQQPAVS